MNLSYKYIFLNVILLLLSYLIIVYVPCAFDLYVRLIIQVVILHFLTLIAKLSHALLFDKYVTICVHPDRECLVNYIKYKSFRTFYGIISRPYSIIITVGLFVFLPIMLKILILYSLLHDMLLKILYPGLLSNSWVNYMNDHKVHVVNRVVILNPVNKAIKDILEHNAKFTIWQKYYTPGCRIAHYAKGHVELSHVNDKSLMLVATSNTSKLNSIQTPLPETLTLTNSKKPGLIIEEIDKCVPKNEFKKVPVSEHTIMQNKILIEKSVYKLINEGDKGGASKLCNMYDINFNEVLLKKNGSHVYKKFSEDITKLKFTYYWWKVTQIADKNNIKTLESGGILTDNKNFKKIIIDKVMYDPLTDEVIDN